MAVRLACLVTGSLKLKEPRPPLPTSKSKSLMPRSSLLSLVVGAQALFGDEPSVEVPVVNVPRYLALCWYGM